MHANSLAHRVLHKSDMCIYIYFSRPQTFDFDPLTSCFYSPTPILFGDIPTLPSDTDTLTFHGCTRISFAICNFKLLVNQSDKIR